MTVVDDSRHPGVVIDAGGVAAHYAIFMVGETAFCGEGCEGINLFLGVWVYLESFRLG